MNVLFKKRRRNKNCFCFFVFKKYQKSLHKREWTRDCRNCGKHRIFFQILGMNHKNNESFLCQRLASILSNVVFFPCKGRLKGLKIFLYLKMIFCILMYLQKFYLLLKFQCLFSLDKIFFNKLFVTLTVIMFLFRIFFHPLFLMISFFFCR